MSIGHMTTVLCLECEEPLDLDDEVQSGDIILCGGCEAEMEVVSVKPARLTFYFGDDWDEDDDDDPWGDSAD